MDENRVGQRAKIVKKPAKVIVTPVKKSKTIINMTVDIFHIVSITDNDT